MNMYRIDAVELSRTKTLITNFMLETSSNFKTFLELVMIFENNYQQIVDDRSDDLRILRFTEDMANWNWNGDIIIQSQNGIAIDGVHRGIAFLRCVNLKEIPENKLPYVYVSP